MRDGTQQAHQYTHGKNNAQWTRAEDYPQGQRQALARYTAKGTAPGKTTHSLPQTVEHETAAQPNGILKSVESEHENKCNVLSIVIIVQGSNCSQHRLPMGGEAALHALAHLWGGGGRGVVHLKGGQQERGSPPVGGGGRG